MNCKGYESVWRVEERNWKISQLVWKVPNVLFDNRSFSVSKEGERTKVSISGEVTMFSPILPEL